MSSRLACPEFGSQLESEFDLCWKCLRFPRKAGLLSEIGLANADGDQFDARRLFNDSPYPVSEHCPQCDCSHWQAVWPSPWFWIGIRRDRVCPDCLIRFIPPVPGWAKALYLISGMTFLACLAAIVTVGVVPGWEPAWVRPVAPRLGLLAGLIFCLMIQVRE